MTRQRRVRGSGGLTQVKMRDRLVWRASMGFWIDRPTADGGTERFRKTVTGIGDTPEAAQERLAVNLEKAREQFPEAS
ncbi:hypothetical protein [Microbacterium sp. MRS-1]|uniref:hypothetical protein n=1 Tax=Microbacterium sp. MRS-1 TaxID=1451261 RepID=UPI0004493668|nr:hypothetical protein [Microbacterium sp. MRS-1]EXJ50779.1 hypothetical protein AS96_13150 [Microbacterium sp. MRS-1]